MRAALFLLIGLLACGGRGEVAPQSFNILDYSVVREWEYGMEVRLEPNTADRIREEDVRELNRRLMNGRELQDTFTVVYRGPGGVVARYLRERSQGVDHLEWKGE